MLTGTDLGQIRGIINLYLEGMIWGQPEKLRQAFHPGGKTDQPLILGIDFPIT